MVASATSTTYYVDSTRGVDTGNGLTPATACQKINTCITKGSAVAPTGTNAGEGHTYKLSGTFTEYVIIANTNQSGATFTGCTDNSFADCTVNARDLVVQQGPNTGQPSFYINTQSPNVRLRNMTIWSQNTSGRAISILTTGPDIQDCRIIQADSTVNTYLISLSGASGSIIKNNIFEGGSGNLIIYATGVSGGTVADNIFMGNRALSGTSWTIRPITHSGTTKMYVYNNVFTDTYTDGVKSTGSGGMNAQNNIIFGGTAQPLQGSTGVITEDHNIIIGNPNTGLHVTGVTSGGNTVYDVDPKFQSHGKQGYLIPMFHQHFSPVPDAGFLTSYLQSIGTRLSSNSMSGTFYVDYVGPVYRSQPALYRSILTDPAFGSGAWEIGSAGWSWTESDNTNVGAFTCVSGACGSAKWRILVGPPVKLQIDINGDGTSDYEAIGASAGTVGTGDMSDSPGSWVYGASNEVIALATVNSISIAFTLNSGSVGTLLMSSINPVVWTAFGASNYLTLNRTSTDCTSGACSPFYLDEIYNPKIGMESMINGAGNITDPQTGNTYSCNSYEYGSTDADYRTAIKSSGFLTGLSTSGDQQNLSSFNLYGIYALPRNNFFASNSGCTASSLPYSCCSGVGAGTCDGTSAGAAETTRLINYLSSRAAEYGLVYGLSTVVSNSSAPDTTNGIPLTGLNSWDTIFAALSDVQDRGLIKVRSAQKVQAELIASPWTDNGDGTVSRTYGASAISDLHLLSSSPAIDAGTTAATTTDFLGLPIYGLPDIGAYEYQPPYTFATNNIPTTGSIRLYADGQYRALIATTSTATATFSVKPAENYYYATTSQYLDITIDNWETTGDHNKQWTATSTTGAYQEHATSTIYSITDLSPNMPYTFKLDGLASTTAVTGTACTAGVCTADAEGHLTFTYIGGYSTHIFALDADITVPASTLTAPVAGPVSGSVTLTATATDNVAIAGVQFYHGTTLIGAEITVPASADTYTTTWDTTSLTNGSYTLIAVARDTSNNYATSTGVAVTVSNSITATITTPPSDVSVANQIVTFSATGSALVGLASLQFALDGINYSAPSLTSPYSIILDSLTLTNGSHILTATTKDNAGNYATSTGVTLKVVNTLDVRHLDSTPAVSQRQHLPLPGETATVDTLLAKIAELRAQIAALTGHSNTTTPALPPLLTQAGITRSWSFGQSGTEVKQLQQFLNTHGFSLAKAGPGSLGHETTYFGYGTRSAVIRFQKKYGIDPIGVVGPRTRGRILQILGQ